MAMLDQLPTLLLVRCPGIHDRVRDFLQRAFTNWGMDLPTPRDLPFVTRLSTFDALARNALMLRIPVEHLESEDQASLFNFEGPPASIEDSGLPVTLRPTALQRTAGIYDEDALCDALCCELLDLDSPKNAALVVWGEAWDAAGWEFSAQFFNNWGLGLQTVKQLALHNPARIYLAARSQEKAEEAIRGLQTTNPNTTNITFLKLDLASLESVKVAASEFLKRETRLDIIVNNAGIMMTPEGLTEDGYEIQFGTNVMGPALFTQLLLPTMRETSKVNPQTRVVMLSSAAHIWAPSNVYDFAELRTTMPHRKTTERYTMSKLADLHYTKALAERKTDVKGFFLRPFLHVVGIFATPVEKGALSQIWAAVSPGAKSGQYYGPVGKAESGSQAGQNRELQESLLAYIQTELKDHVGKV
ncbi:short-chain dehydrogenase reductase [Colletotrichum sojae]|uniref:Short-chain dehydrogenase reductase n=1 Tax=Colletotrichum sojae TaxID=2175907 RepID=A0A8H6MMC8_9PEZI|nr:short-chain dehydrogenase reductase [Colletotrichum sojae]